MVDAVAALQALLHNNAARQHTVAKAEPASPSADYLTGFGAGWEAGQVSATALALSALTGESPTKLVEQAMANAAVDAAFPFDLHFECQ